MEYWAKISKTLIHFILLIKFYNISIFVFPSTKPTLGFFFMYSVINVLNLKILDSKTFIQVSILKSLNLPVLPRP